MILFPYPLDAIEEEHFDDFFSKRRKKRRKRRAPFVLPPKIKYPKPMIRPKIIKANTSILPIGRGIAKKKIPKKQKTIAVTKKPAPKKVHTALNRLSKDTSKEAIAKEQAVEKAVASDTKASKLMPLVIATSFVAIASYGAYYHLKTKK